MGTPTYLYMTWFEWCTQCIYHWTELSSLFTVYFDSNCDDFDTYTIFDDDTYYIKWRGSKLSSSCSYKFSPYDTDHKVCVEAVSFYINDCNVNLQYYGGIIATLLQRVLFDLMNIHLDIYGICSTQVCKHTYIGSKLNMCGFFFGGGCRGRERGGKPTKEIFAIVYGIFFLKFAIHRNGV